MLDINELAAQIAEAVRVSLKSDLDEIKTRLDKIEKRLERIEQHQNDDANDRLLVIPYQTNYYHLST